MGRRKKKRPKVIRPWSKGKCPTATEIVEAWTNRSRSLADFIWLLSVLGELTCFTDCNLEHLGGFGNIAGRRGGLKAFLEAEVPELAKKYKSISRYATLVTRLKMAFSYYPPAPISLIHPDLPKPSFEVADTTTYAHYLYDLHFKSLEPTYAAFAELVKRRLKSHPPRYQWGPALPRDAWEAAERKWYKEYACEKLLKEIGMHYKYYSPCYNPYDKWKNWAKRC